MKVQFKKHIHTLLKVKEINIPKGKQDCFLMIMQIYKSITPQNHTTTNEQLIL